MTAGGWGGCLKERERIMDVLLHGRQRTGPRVRPSPLMFYPRGIGLPVAPVTNFPSFICALMAGGWQELWPG